MEELGLVFEQDDVPNEDMGKIGTTEPDWDRTTDTPEMQRCFAHDHNIDTGELLWECGEPGAWVLRLPQGNMYLCDEHMKERGNDDESYKPVEA